MSMVRMKTSSINSHGVLPIRIRCQSPKCISSFFIHVQVILLCACCRCISFSTCWMRKQECWLKFPSSLHSSEKNVQAFLLICKNSILNHPMSLTWFYKKRWGWFWNSAFNESLPAVISNYRRHLRINLYTFLRLSSLFSHSSRFMPARDSIILLKICKKTCLNKIL